MGRNVAHAYQLQKICENRCRSRVAHVQLWNRKICGSRVAHVQLWNIYVPELHMCNSGTASIFTDFLKLVCSGHVQAHSQLLDSKTFVQCARTSALDFNTSGQRWYLVPALNQLRINFGSTLYQKSTPTQPSPDHTTTRNPPTIYILVRRPD